VLTGRPRVLSQNGGFAVLRSGAKLFIFLGDFVGLDRLTTFLLADSVSRFVGRIGLLLCPKRALKEDFSIQAHQFAVDRRVLNFQLGEIVTKVVKTFI
jgi:hypothetical protein